MRYPWILLLFLLLFLASHPAPAQKVHIDFDGATAFSEYKTFALKETRFDLRRFASPLHQRVVRRLTDYAADGGLEKDNAEPDVYLAYYAAFRGDLRLVLSDLEYTYGPGFSLGSYWDGGVGTRDVSQKAFIFKEGTLVIDVWDRERKVLVWRGMATAALKSDAKNEKTLEKALAKLMKQWEKMYGGRARALRKLKAERTGH